MSRSECGIELRAVSKLLAALFRLGDHRGSPLHFFCLGGHGGRPYIRGGAVHLDTGAGQARDDPIRVDDTLSNGAGKGAVTIFDLRFTIFS